MSTAKDHDTTIDLSKRGIIVYRDRKYFGHDPRGIDGTMDKSVRNHKLSIESLKKPLRTSRKISLVEYPYSIIKRVFHISLVMVTTVKKVRENSCLHFLYTMYMH